MSFTRAPPVQIVRAHLIEGTLSFQSISEETMTGPFVATSLGGFDWTFESREDASGGMFPVLVDSFNLTTTGDFPIATDITATDANIWCAPLVHVCSMLSFRIS